MLPLALLRKPTALALALLTCGFAALPSARAAAGKLIYFMNYADTPSGTHYQIYLINADGTGNTRIVHPDSDDTYPSLSPDGTTIAFLGGGVDGIALMNVDGTNVRAVPHSSGYFGAVWSPDGKRLAAVSQATGGIVTMNADGTGVHTVSSTLYAIPSIGVSWSPDGTKVAYTARDEDGLRTYRLLVANADGTGTVTKVSLDDNSDYGDPGWSPDGTKIAVRKYSTDDYGIHLVDVATGAETIPGGGIVNGASPTWSPDGTQLAFESYADDSYGNILVVKPDGSSPQVLQTIGQANAVQWSRAGGFTTGGGGTAAGTPVITSTGLGPIYFGQPFDYTITTDGTVPIAKYAADILPTGLSLNTGTGEIFGTVQAGDVPDYTSITITVTSTAGVSASKDLPLTFRTAVPQAAFSVSLTKPSGNVNASEGTVLKLKAKVDLTNAGSETVANLSFLVDGKIVGTLAAKPYKLLLPLDDTLVGTHQLTVQAVGNDNRVAGSSPITLTVSPSFVDLAGTATLSAKEVPGKGKLKIKGDYTLSNLGNEAAGPFVIKFYLSDDQTFDAGDLDVGPLLAQVTGKAGNLDIPIPGLPANTTLDSSVEGSLLPKLKLTVPDAAITTLGLSGKYILAVIDPTNAVGEDESTRANNVIVVRIP